MMDLKQITWDYGEPLEGELWQPEGWPVFPFVVEDLTGKGKSVGIRRV